MAHLIGALAGWLYANVLGNLVASGITTTAGLAWHHRRIRDHISAEVRLLHAHRAAREVHDHEEAL